MEIYILRIHRGVAGDDIRGTVEVPGEEPQPFSGAEALLRILDDGPPDQVGNASGSTSSSAIRET